VRLPTCVRRRGPQPRPAAAHARAAAAVLACTVVVCAAAAGCVVVPGLGGDTDSGKAGGSDGSDGPGGSGGSGGAGSVAAAPRVGQCYATPDAVLADPHDPSAPVACSRPHTLETYAVLHPDGPLGPRTLAAADEACVRRAGSFLGGGDFTQTAVSVYFFTPTKAQRADGARWVRCDLGVVTDTAVSGARPVTGSLRGAFSDGVPTVYRRCLDAPPDPASVQPLVRCDQPHVAQLVPTGRRLGDASTPYPGMDRLAERANARCSQTVRSALPEAARSLVVVPTRSMWNAGSTAAQCWALAAPGERLNASEAQPV
jgi:Septum formation